MIILNQISQANNNKKLKQILAELVLLILICDDRPRTALNEENDEDQYKYLFFAS